MSNLHSNRFIPKYCDLKLACYEKNYDFIDIAKWNEFDKKDFFIANVNLTSFSQIYKDIGFKPVNGSLKKTARFSSNELQTFDHDIKKVKLLMNL